MTYWTVIIPPVPFKLSTKWHDTSGRASTLSRGAFRTKDEAKKWGKEHLHGAPFSVRKIDAGGKRRHSPKRKPGLGKKLADLRQMMK